MPPDPPPSPQAQEDSSKSVSKRQSPVTPNMVFQEDGLLRGAREVTVGTTKAGAQLTHKGAGHPEPVQVVLAPKAAPSRASRHPELCHVGPEQPGAASPLKASLPFSPWAAPASPLPSSPCSAMPPVPDQRDTE